METMQQENTVVQEEKTLTLKERFKEFQGEFGKIGQRHREVQERQREVYLEYHRSINERDDLLAINEVEAAGALDQKIKDLRSQVDGFEKEIMDLSPERIKQVVTEHPESKLHIMALAIQTEGLEEMEKELAELDQANSEFEKVRDQYLKVVERIGNCYRGLVDTHLIIRKAEKMLPEKKSKEIPRVLNWTNFEISEKKLSKSFGKKPFINP